MSLSSSYRSMSKEAGVGQIIHVQEFASRLARSPDHNFRGAALLRLMNPAQQRGQNMGVLQAEIVPWPVRIRRHDTDRVETVLPAVRLAHLEPGNLCDSVWLVGRLQRAAICGRQPRR